MPSTRKANLDQCFEWKLPYLVMSTVITGPFTEFTNVIIIPTHIHRFVLEWIITSNTIIPQVTIFFPDNFYVELKNIGLHKSQAFLIRFSLRI